MSFPLKKSALLLHTVDDVEHFVRSGVGKGTNLILSTRMALPEFRIIKKKNWIHLLGIESPRLTAAPTLAKNPFNLL